MDDYPIKKYDFETEEDSGDEEPWMMTYGDMMTLLMTFFVLLFSMSTIDPVKLEKFSKGVGGHHGASQTHTSLSELYDAMKNIVQEENLQDVVNVESGPFGVKMNIPSELTFSTGAADLTQQLQPFLSKLVPTMKGSIFPIAIIGHTDSDPIHTAQFPSYWELSASRASAVARFFISQGIKADRLIAVGKADTEPLVPNTSPQNKAENRRVEIQFLTESL